MLICQFLCYVCIANKCGNKFCKKNLVVLCVKRISFILKMFMFYEVYTVFRQISPSIVIYEHSNLISREHWKITDHNSFNDIELYLIALEETFSMTSKHFVNIFPNDSFLIEDTIIPKKIKSSRKIEIRLHCFHFPNAINI